MRLVAFLISFLFVTVAMSASFAHAAKIKKVNFNQDEEGVFAELVFDKAVSARSLHWGTERNFGQVVIKNAVMDSSKIFRASGSDVEKVMVYPYSNDTVRVRFISTQKNIQKAQIRNQSASVVRIFVAETKKSETMAQKPAASVENKGEDDLIKEVVANTKEIDISNPDSIKAAIIQKPAEKETLKEAGEIGTKAEPSRPFFKMVGGLVLVIGLMVGLVYLLKKYGSNRLPFNKKERIIQVVATHYLGSKKSISLVKVAGEYMVVGSSNENISLISKLGAEVSVDKYLEDRFWGGTFEKHLGSYTKDVSVTKDVSLAGYDGTRDLALENKTAATKAELTVEAKKLIADQTRSPVSNVRSSIRERLSQLKPLS